MECGRIGGVRGPLSSMVELSREGTPWGAAALEWKGRAELQDCAF